MSVAAPDKVSILLTKLMFLLQPRDCATEPHIESYAVTSRSSCPKYVSLPVQVSSGKFSHHSVLSIYLYSRFNMT